MRVKIFCVCIFLLVFCSGCSVEYNLDIDRNLDLNENINISATTFDDSEQINNYDKYLPIDYTADEPKVFEKKYDSIEYYDINKSNDNIKFSYNYDVDKFNNNIFARNCYQYVTVMNTINEEEERNELILSTSKKFLCFDYYDNLEDVTIKIKTKRKVYSNNADRVEGKTYIWNINKNNKEDSAINIIMDSSPKSSLSFLEKNLLWIIMAGILFICGVIYFVIKRRSDGVNKI